MLTVMSFVDAPVLHSNVAPVEGVAVSFMLPPAQKLAVAPLLMLIVGKASFVIAIGNDVLIQPSASVAVNDTVAEFERVRGLLVAPLLQVIFEREGALAVNETVEPSQKLVPEAVILTALGTNLKCMALYILSDVNTFIPPNVILKRAIS